ncbi:MAG: UbiX family flavin prenyltransferase [Thermoplasmata archaeon]|nr:UbiX family flavin prenyltransferase [Thermoplasmata archaeon]
MGPRSLLSRGPLGSIKGRGRALSEEPPIVVGVTGASGAPIALRALRALHEAKVPVALVVSDGAVPVLMEECGIRPSDLAPYARDVYSDHDLASPIASGSRRTRAMAIVPCSSNTLAKVALGLADTLLTRAAAVHLKERRPLVVVPRETPVSTISLRHMTALSEMGVVVLPASGPYYTHPRSVDDITDFLAGKVLDALGVPHHLYRGWKEGTG